MDVMSMLCSFDVCQHDNTKNTKWISIKLKGRTGPEMFFSISLSFISQGIMHGSFLKRIRRIQVAGLDE